MVLGMLKAYKGKHVQHAKQMMVSCRNDGLTLAECIGFMERFIAEPRQNLCPDCGTEMMRIATGAEKVDASMSGAELANVGVKIFECPDCRKSEVR